MDYFIPVGHNLLDHPNLVMGGLIKLSEAQLRLVATISEVGESHVDFTTLSPIDNMVVCPVFDSMLKDAHLKL